MKKLLLFSLPCLLLLLTGCVSKWDKVSCDDGQFACEGTVKNVYSCYTAGGEVKATTCYEVFCSENEQRWGIYGVLNDKFTKEDCKKI